MQISFEIEIEIHDFCNSLIIIQEKCIIALDISVFTDLRTER